MSAETSLTRYLHERYMQRMENELDFNWKRINIGLIALIASIAGYGVIVTRAGYSPEMNLVAPANANIQTTILYTLASFAVLPLVSYMIVLVNQGRFWYRVNEAKVVWCETVLMKTTHQSEDHIRCSPTSLYQIGNGTSGRLSIYRGMKLPLYGTAVVFISLAAYNATLWLLLLMSMTPDSRIWLIVCPLAALLFLLVVLSDFSSRGQIHLHGFNKRYAVDDCAQQEMIKRLSELE